MPFSRSSSAAESHPEASAGKAWAASLSRSVAIRGVRVDAQFERLDCVFGLNSEEGLYCIRKKRRKATPAAPSPPTPRPLVSESSVPTAERLVELIAAAGNRTKEEIVENTRRSWRTVCFIIEACQLWVKLRATKR